MFTDSEYLSYDLMLDLFPEVFDKEHLALGTME